jgi:hypothetical protein
MSHWFTIHLKPTTGSLAAAMAALAAANIAVEGIVGSPESEDGVVHLSVAEAARDRATAALQSVGISVSLEAVPDADASATEGLIGAILNGPRT